MSSEHSDVLIAGAGPTGLLLALWLTRLGIGVRIVDPKLGPTTETRAIAVQARTLEFYDQLGLGQETMARGRPFSTANLWVDGRLAGAFQLDGGGKGTTPHPYTYRLTQDQNEAMLVAALEENGTQVEWGTQLNGFTQQTEGVSAVLTTKDQTRTVQASYLAGCDGARSVVRHELGINMTGGTYDKRFYVADVTASGRLHQGSVNLGLNADHFLAFFPMSEVGRHRVIGQISDSAGEEPTFEAVRPEIEAFGLAHIEQVHWFSTYRVHHRVADHFRQGRVFLLGDAGHLHSPVGGQGMNTGLGDAVNLGWKLVQAIRNPETGLLNEEVLDSYESERLPFARSLVGITDRFFTAIFAQGASARLLRTRIIPALMPRLTRFGAVKKRLFLTVSQTSLHYPDSSLSVGQAGKVKGGDRLPWIPDGQDSNFGVLKALCWQVHVYGSPTPELLAWCAQVETPLHVFPFSSAARRAGVAEDAVYLVRPDGYVGGAFPRFDQQRLDDYARRWMPGRGPATPVKQPVAAD